MERRMGLGHVVIQRTIRILSVGALSLALAGCATSPPKNPGNACAIFEEKDDWFDALEDSEDRWGAPMHVQLAILKQESSFVHDARPPREKILWVIPWKRPSSAYGYAQVLDSTWDWYEDRTGNSGSRTDFDDVTDFVGWYMHMSHETLGLSMTDAYSQYLAYHEGHGGFKRRTYASKGWLIEAARRVQRYAARYESQIARCRSDFEGGWFDWF
jgi:hypothetical protein